METCRERPLGGGSGGICRRRQRTWGRRRREVRILTPPISTMRWRIPRASGSTMSWRKKLYDELTYRTKPYRGRQEAHRRRQLRQVGGGQWAAAQPAPLGKGHEKDGVFHGDLLRKRAGPQAGARSPVSSWLPRHGSGCGSLGKVLNMALAAFLAQELGQ